MLGSLLVSRSKYVSVGLSVSKSLSFSVFVLQQILSAEEPRGGKCTVQSSL